MAYVPINTQAYTAAYSGAVAGMAVNGWISSPTGGNYTLVCAVAGAFAEAFDVAWNNAAQPNSLELAAIQSVCAQEFSLRGPGPLAAPQFQDPANWAVSAKACATLALQCDLYFAGQGITPPTPGGGGAPIPRTYWVSPLSTGSSEDGSAGNPFLTGQAAIDALETEGVGGVLLLACGQGVNFGPMVCTSVDIALVGFGNTGSNSADRPFVTVTVAGGIRFTAENCALSFQVSLGAGATLSFTQCFLFTCSLQDCTVWQMIDCDGVVVTLSADTVVLREAVNCRLTGIGGFGNPLASALLKSCEITGGILATALTLIDTPVPGAGADQITCDTLNAEGSQIDCQVNVGTSSVLDTFTLQSLRNGAVANAFTHTLGTFTISDHPLATGLTFTVPNLAAAFADVSVAFPGCVPGDTFDVTTTTRLADVGIVDAFCSVTGNVTLRFFGTTAGGDVVCNINLNANSPNAV